MKKAKVIETLEKLPDEFSTEELIDKLLFIDKVEKGLQDVEDGKVISLDKARRSIREKWSK